MKYIFFLLASITFLSCSKDATTAPIADNPVDYANSKIISFSKNAGTSGETITLNGENLTSDVSKISLKFDADVATIVSATTTEIKFILPVSVKTIPVLKLTISNNNIQNLVVNEYSGNIGILPVPVYNSWQAVESTLIKQVGTNSPFIYRIQHIDSKKVYVATIDYGGSAIFRTLDGGISWQRWTTNIGFGRNGFWVLNTDNGWAGMINGVHKVQVGGNPDSAPLADIILPTTGSDNTVYVDNDLQHGTVITAEGKVLTTNDGLAFTEVYRSLYINPNSVYTFLEGVSFAINNNAIWAAGAVTTNGSYYRPTIIYKNSALSDWQEYLFPVEQYYSQFPRRMVFTSVTNGFLLVHNYNGSVSGAPVNFVSSKIYQTTNGGNSWASIYETGQSLTSITFKDANVGWAASGNQILKTIDGGATWTLDFNNNQIIRNISYKNNEVWAFSLDKFFKYRIQ